MWTSWIRSYRALFAAPATYGNFKQSDLMGVSRIGINYRFGGGAAYARVLIVHLPTPSVTALGQPLPGAVSSLRGSGNYFTKP